MIKYFIDGVPHYISDNRQNSESEKKYYLKSIVRI